MYQCSSKVHKVENVLILKLKWAISFRLEKMRLAIGSRIRKKEVLIPTSSGLLRFPGISRKFTQKLYEWEKAQGIGPEASTFALLDSSYQPELKDIREKFKGMFSLTKTILDTY